ncbi:hypothetical protein O1611_g216 [Lasiodiplodia mahajangana]|uniref:Uncharacterized protein n=1 Tax=Lasiodiplodia mahajangana TaxID=1108764 RepID=A0ACC2K0W5_9PEZI|nr:hypothetical protein O1611_g216 [Lasiodiplodia mahajangana]
MTSPMPQCRGFTHPFVLLVRSALRSRSTLEAPTRITTRRLAFLTTPSRHPRFFSSCRAFSSIKPGASAAGTEPKKTPPTSSLASKIHPLSHYSYAQRLAMKSQPTMLYEAASQTGFLISSYGAAFFCLGSAGINSWFNVYNLPPGISSLVPAGFGVVSFMFAVIGTVFALRPSSIIRSIKVLPNAALQKTPASPSHPVVLEVAARRISPIPLPLKRIRVAPEQIVMVNRLQRRPVVLSREQLAAKKQEDARRRKEERQYELDHLMTAPFRDAGRASATLLGNIRRGLTGEGFAPVFINGTQYKLDIDGGYALENGQALDQIVRIQPDPQLARTQSESSTKKK